MVDPTLLTVQPIAVTAALPSNVGANITWSPVTATNGDMYPTTGKEIVLIRHADSGVLTVTAYSNACNQGFTTLHNMVKTIVAGNVTEQFAALPPMSASHFGQTFTAGANMVKILCTGTLAATQIAVVQFTEVGN